MSAPFPQWFEWSGEAMIPLNPKAADRIYTIGQRYHLEHREARSSQSHAHYFACINEAWQNLRGEAAERFSSPEHLRKWALIRVGYRDVRSFACASKKEAHRLAGFLRPVDEFAVIVVSGATVTMMTAQSQNMRSMDRKTFGASKTAVLEVLADLIGVSPEQLGRAA